ncbi:MAG: TetR/AcrR family transcriptional regulator [Stackebrandtia sp.]
MTESMPETERALRADAERTQQQILSAAQRVLSADPAATMADVARAAGVARTTVHRRFVTRESLIEAMSEWAARRVHDAIDAGGDDTVPPLVGLYQATARVLEVKIATPDMTHQVAPSAATLEIQSKMADKCRQLFQRAQDSDVLRADVDLDWARRVYYALIHEVIDDERADLNTRATRVVDTLLRGIGTGASVA